MEKTLQRIPEHVDTPVAIPSLSAQAHPFRCFDYQIALGQAVSTSYPSLRAIDLDQKTVRVDVVAITVGVVSVAVGIGTPVFYKTQIGQEREHAAVLPLQWIRSTKMQIFSGDWKCNGRIRRGEKEVLWCINCDGAGSLTCTTCQGSGIEPRYLDRREFEDND